MQPHIAMVLVHRTSREAILFVARSLQGRQPDWERDPQLQDALWSFAKTVAEYNSEHQLDLSIFSSGTPAPDQMVFSQLPHLSTLVERMDANIREMFGDLYGIMSDVNPHFCLSRLAFYVSVVAQAQCQNRDPDDYI